MYSVYILFKQPDCNYSSDSEVRLFCIPRYLGS